MADYGQAGALAYEIPQHFLGSPQGGNYPPPQEGIASHGGAYGPAQDAAHPLAEREHLTDNYYNNYGILDSYAKDMAKKGINVFEPDYSQPGGGEAFKTFQRMQANVMHGANALKVEMEAEKETRKLEGEGKVRMEPGAKREGLYYSKPENFYSTAIAPGVTQANTLLGDQFGTQQNANAANTKVRDYQLHHLQEVRKTLAAQGKSTTEVDNDIHALLSATNVSPAIEAAGIRRAASGAAKYDTSIFKKMYNIGSGSFAPGDYKIIPHSKHGAVWSYEGLKGDKFGTWEDKTNPDKPVLREKIIKNVYASPKTHEVIVSFSDPKIPDETIQDPYHFAREVISNNSKHGDFARTMRAVFDQGMGDEESGGVNPSAVLDPNTPKYQQNMFDEMGVKSQAVDQAQTLHKEAIKKLEEHWYGNESKPLPTPKGDLIVKRDGADRFKITNYDQFWPEEDDSAAFEGLTEDQVIERMNELGAYDKTLSGPAAPPKTLTFKGKSVSIEALKKNGWTDALIQKGLADGTLK